MKDHRIGRSRTGWLMPMVGGPHAGYQYRMTEPFDQEMSLDGATYRLTKDYEGPLPKRAKRYEWTYVYWEESECSPTTNV